MLQELIEAEAAVRIGAEWNEHTETRTALRNGQRDKTLRTQAGAPKAPPCYPTPPTRPPDDRLHHEKGHDQAHRAKKATRP
ncbi:transposase [Streptomyces diastatochromogenes]|uniref:transposase n=1 Tax=Streptomyces diastatochromogenes TaxID=42236 RepID=UPI0036535A6C